MSDQQSEENQTLTHSDHLAPDALANLLLERSRGSRVYLVGTIMGIVVGSMFCVAGFVLAVLGLNGSIEWVFEASSIKSRMSNASPGAIFALMGMIVLWRYKPKVKDHLKMPWVDHSLETSMIVGSKAEMDRVFEKSVRGDIVHGRFE